MGLACASMTAMTLVPLVGRKQSWPTIVTRIEVQTAILVYGQDEIEYSRPNYLPAHKWFIAVKYMSSQDSPVRC